MTSVVTPKVERTKGGMRKWMFFEKYYSRIDDEPFLSRYVLFFTPWAGLHVTRIHKPDNQREWPHDHSATFWSWKFGWYAENVYSGDPLNPVKTHVKHRRFGIHRLGWDQAHSITEVSPHLWTILFLGRRRNRSSYWTPQGKQSLEMTMDDEWS
jgi:hypothetical protein